MKKSLLILTLLVPFSLSAYQLEMEIYNWGEKNENSALTVDSSDASDMYIETEINEGKKGKFLTVNYWYSEPINCSAYEAKQNKKTWYIGAETVTVKQQCKVSDNGEAYFENKFEKNNN